MKIINITSQLVMYTLNNKGSSKKSNQYYYHATPGEPGKGSPGVAW